MDFLKIVAQELQARNIEEQNYTVIFPNTRSIKYFRRYYAEIIDAPQLLATVPWQRFLDDALQLSSANELILIFELFHSFKRVLGKNPLFKDYTLDKFFSLGQTILSDFNEIDNYLIPPEKIFINLAELEELSSHDFITEKQKQAIKRLWTHYYKKDDLKFFVELFNSLVEIYHDFHKRLKDRKIVYSGLRNRMIVEKLSAGIDLFEKYDNVALVGFYALSKSERKIMEFLKQEHNAIFYWDLDKHYYDDGQHEAGFFLRLNMKNFPNELDIKYFDNLSERKDIKVVSAPKNVSQAKIIPWALQDIGISEENKDRLSRTAIILLDESLLFPVLYSLPEYVEKVNITLQFPFHLTSLYSFFSKWFALLRQQIVAGRIYYKDLLTLIKTETAQKYFGDLANAVIDKIGNKQVNFLYEKFFTELFEENIPGKELFLFEKKDAQSLLQGIYSVVYSIMPKAQELEKEYLYHILTNITSLKNNIEELGDELNSLIVLQLLTEILYSVRVPFEGESIDKLQIMTIMETRNIDFDNVIILGMNEGIFPRISRSQSFFTEFIRRAYNLPILNYQDSLYSYFFYRLIQRAKNVYLIYNSIPDHGIGGKSRYILQLEKETNLISDYVVFSDTMVIPEIAHNFQLTERYDYNPEYISVSAISTYIECPRKFFYSYIADLKEPTTADEKEFSFAEFGILVHSTLEKIYSSIASINNNIVDRKSLLEAKKKLSNYITQVISSEESLSGLDFSSGMNKILLHAVETYILKVIDYDIENFETFEVISLERDRLTGNQAGYSTTFYLDENKSISLYGIFDRVDKISLDNAEVIRIVDYKTGKKETKIKSVEELFYDRPNPAAFQLLFYKLLVKDRREFKGKNVVPALYSIPQLNDRGFSVYLNIDNKLYDIYNHQDLDKEIMPVFEEGLREILNKILFGDKTFERTEDNSICEYCPYRQLCGR